VPLQGRFGIVNRVVGVDGRVVVGRRLDRFRLEGHDFIPDPTVPGGVSLQLDERAPYMHLGGLEDGRDQEALGHLGQAWREQDPRLPAMMISIRGLPVNVTARVLGGLGKRPQTLACMEEVQRFPGLWARPFPDVAQVIQNGGV